MRRRTHRILDVKGGVNLSMAYNRKDIDYKRDKPKIKGVMTVSVGMQATAGGDKLLKATVQGTTGLSLLSADFYNDDKGMGVAPTIEFPGIMADWAFEFFDGWITSKYSAELMAKHKFEPIRLGTDTFQ
jgi:hypothetical protein